MSELKVSETNIPGLKVVDLQVHEDDRGSFREVFQAEKLGALGLNGFEPKQQNVSFNKEVGVTRGFHAEPWDKYVHVINGKAFAAWVDIRKGDSFGQVFSIELTPSNAVFVPRGVANSYQTLESNVAYSYLVNGHWSADLVYPALSLFDEAVAVDWPIDLDKAIVSEKDTHQNPTLTEIKAQL